MKKTILIICLLLILTFVSGCVTNSPIETTNATTNMGNENVTTEVINTTEQIEPEDTVVPTSVNSTEGTNADATEPGTSIIPTTSNKFPDDNTTEPEQQIPTTVNTVPTTENTPETNTTEPPQTPETTTPAVTEPETTAPITVTYPEYLAMSGQDQAAFIDSFDSLEAFFAWLNQAKAEYEDQRIPIDGTTPIAP